MKMSEFNWIINDCFNSLNRLDRIYQDIEFFLDKIDMEKDYIKCLDNIKDNLNYLKKDHDYFTAGEYLCEILKYCWKLIDIHDQLDEILTDENFHRENRILENEPMMIRSYINEIDGSVIY